METSHRLVALPEVLRRDLSKVIRWEICGLAIEVETGLEKNIGGGGVTISVTTLRQVFYLLILIL